MRDEVAKKGIDYLVDFGAAMVKSSVAKMFDPDFKEEDIEKHKVDIKRDLKRKLKTFVCMLLEDEEEEKA